MIVRVCCMADEIRDHDVQGGQESRIWMSPAYNDPGANLLKIWKAAATPPPVPASLRAGIGPCYLLQQVTFLEDPCAGPSLRRNAAHVVSSLQLCSGRVRANWKSP
mmetsp:Transcript_44184/g.99365  ORF Transcript_44184/g.99365 Transcript_44184/m.99365 type:complete len:106 (+) Transcript_44184:2322-2639(+)